MTRSIRGRLLLWNAAVLVGVVAGFAGILYYRVREARLAEVDRRLVAWAHYLDAHLRAFPPHELDPQIPFKPPPPFGWPPPGKPPHPPRERLLAGLMLPDVPGRADEPPSTDPPYFGVWRYDGTLLKAANLPGAAGEPPDEPGPEPQLLRRGPWREAVVLGPHRSRIRVGVSLAHDFNALRAYAWQLAAVGGGVLVLGLAGVWWISARIVRPISVISRTASAISATHLGERIDPRHVDAELAALAQVLNATFDRLEQAFERQARFTADASHELRTPLTLLRTHAELALSRPRSAEEYRETVEGCLRAAQRMSALVEALLTLARADAGKLELRREPMALAQVVADALTQLHPLALAAGLTVEADLEKVSVAGDAARLAQVITNLIGNAVQYNRPGGRIVVRLGVEGATAVLSVADTGCGIPMEDRPHVFERFYRVDKARARATGGHGLGLAICRSIVEAHGGTIDFTTEREQGTTFRVRLPVVKDSNASSAPHGAG